MDRPHDVPDDFRDLRHDGVAEGSNAVHSAGNPMNHSHHVGFSPPMRRSSSSPMSQANGGPALGRRFLGCAPLMLRESRRVSVGSIPARASAATMPSPDVGLAPFWL